MKNMLSREDIGEVRKIVREEIRDFGVTKDEFKKLSDTVGKHGGILAHLLVTQAEMNETLTETNGMVKKILSTIDAFLKKNEKLDHEQKIQGEKLTRHDKWFKQVGDKTGLKFEY